MEIIDAQVHIWRKGIGTPPHLTTPYLAEDAIRDMDAAGIDGAILHPPASWDPASIFPILGWGCFLWGPWHDDLHSLVTTFPWTPSSD